MSSTPKTLLAALNYTLGTTAPALQYFLQNPKEYSAFKTSTPVEVEFWVSDSRRFMTLSEYIAEHALTQDFHSRMFSLFFPAQYEARVR